MISKVPVPVERKPINLQGGWPTPRLHPADTMRAAAQDLFAREDIDELLKYGPEHGDRSLRSNIGRWLTESYQPAAGSIELARILVTNGASNGLATIVQKFADINTTRGVWMVEPTYFLACTIFRDAGYGDRIRGVPEGADGIDLEYFERALKEEKNNESEPRLGGPSPTKSAKTGYPKTYRHILYMIPTFSNPSGRTMSVPQRERLVRLAREHDVLVVTDDVYDLLCWAGRSEAHRGGGREAPRIAPPPRLVDVDRSLPGTGEFGNAVSNGSFSKIVAPGVRVGWLESTESFIGAMATVGATVSGGCQGHLSSLILNQMLASGAVTRHLNEVLIPTYRTRHDAMVGEIRRRLGPLGVEILGTDHHQDSDHVPDSEGELVGGFFLYVVFPDDGSLPSGDEIAAFALEEYDLRIAPGKLFTVSEHGAAAAAASAGESRPARYLAGARLCWAWNETEDLIEGVNRLADALGRLRRRDT
ncbi:pyridoxal phosphate-dependent transferase [Xylariaceae sp. FL0804]|nr:pyridoxal phosphate-dependent transferase [Xylariaceae sp. FL0804]